MVYDSAELRGCTSSRFPPRLKPILECPKDIRLTSLPREHTRLFQGQSLQVTSPQGRFKVHARRVTGKVFESCEAVGKHLFYHFEDERIIHVHLGRYGKYRIHESPAPAPVGQVRMRMTSQTHVLDLNGPTTCRVIGPNTREDVVSKLGPDPLSGGNKNKVYERISKSAKPIGALILDQKVIAGIGNIFRAELLFELQLSPLTPGNEIDRSTFDQMWTSLTKMMKTGAKLGKIVTVSKEEAGLPLSQIEGNQRFRVYGKTSCPDCGHKIETFDLAARKIYHCPRCQA